MMRLRGLIGVVAAVVALGALPAMAGAMPGRLYAFGDNYFGQLGNANNNNTNNPNPTPALVSLPGATGAVTQVAAGHDDSLVMTSTGQLYAFGDNASGQLGRASNSGGSDPNPTPARVSLPGATGAVTQIAAGDDHSLVLTSTGQLYAFGDNRYGELGSPTNNGTNIPSPTPVLVSLPGKTGRVTQIAAGGEDSLVLTSAGQLYTFGYNFSGQLGRATNSGTTNPSPTPALVLLPGATGRVTQIAAGGYHSLVLTSTGQLYTFGSNYFGELGRATGSGTGNPSPTAARVSLPGATGRVTEVAAGAYHSLVVTSSGQLYTFGDNHSGQLGRATHSGTDIPSPTPALVLLPGATGRVTQAAAGHDHSIVLTSTGQLYEFGDNGLGQLGGATNSGTSNPNPTPALVAIAVPAGMFIDALSRGPEPAHTLVALAPIPPPALSSLRIAPRKLSLAGREVGGRCIKPTNQNRTHRRCRRPVKLTISYTLSTAATVTFTLKRASAGRTVKGRCVTPTNENKEHHKCTRLSAVRGTISHTGTPGANRVFFNGSIGGRKLGPGSYQLTAAPSTTGRSGTPRTVTFTLSP